MNSYDVVIIGAGAGGASAALALARSRRSVLVIDSGRPRNRFASHVHMYPGREGADPRVLVDDMRREGEAYGAHFIDGAVTEVRGVAGAFTATGPSFGEVEARALVVATGVTDELPAIPGLAELWGADVFHCPYCHGWEVRDRPLAALAVNPGSGRQALLLTQWTNDLTVVGEEEIPDSFVRGIEARGGRILRGAVTSLRRTDHGVQLQLADGTQLDRDAVFLASDVRPNDEVLVGLGADRVVDEHFGIEVVRADGAGATSVPGVWAVGNVVDPSAQVLHAAAAGTRTGAAINVALLQAEVSRPRDDAR